MHDIVDTVRNNLTDVEEEIRSACAGCGRNSEEVSVMAVTKTHPAEYINAAVSCGIEHIGENRVTEGGRKIREVGMEAAVFHAIGVLHRSEVRQALRDFHWIDAVDRLKIIEEIARRKTSREILLEVNTSGEEAKKGFQPDQVLLTDILGRAFELDLNVRGFLTVGPLGRGEADMRKAFSLLREVRNAVSQSLGRKLPVLSMGMSDDFTMAVKEGSTMIRLGRRLFGPRN